MASSQEAGEDDEVRVQSDVGVEGPQGLHHVRDELLLPLGVWHLHDEVHRARDVGAESLGESDIVENCVLKSANDSYSTLLYSEVYISPSEVA